MRQALKHTSTLGMVIKHQRRKRQKQRRQRKHRSTTPNIVSLPSEFNNKQKSESDNGTDFHRHPCDNPDSFRNIKIEKFPNFETDDV